MYPMNDPELVNRFGELLSVDLDMPISLVNIDGMIIFHSILKLVYCLCAPFCRRLIEKASVPLPVYLPNGALLLP